MKEWSFIFVLFLSFLIHTTYCQTTIFLNPKDKPISEEDFNKAYKSGKYIVGENDSLKTKKLIANRVEEGNTDSKKIYATLATQLNKEIDFSKPLLIIYYPGKDPCNASGGFPEEQQKVFYEDMKKRVQEVKSTTILHIYKSPDGPQNRKFINWYNDPQGIIEKEFFKYHYPCFSFVIITPSDNYISYFGEFATETIVNCLKKIKKKR